VPEADYHHHVVTIIGTGVHVVSAHHGAKTSKEGAINDSERLFLKIYRRHASYCTRYPTLKNKPDTYRPTTKKDQNADTCGCPIWCRGYLAKETKIVKGKLRAKRTFASLDTSDWTAAESDFQARLLPPWPDFLVHLTRLPVASIALIRGRATGNGSGILLACDMSFASREKAIIPQWEVGVGMVSCGGPMARLPEFIRRNRALEVLLSAEDIRADQAEAYGYINRALPDAVLDAFVEALATRIAKFDKRAIASTRRLVNTSLSAGRRAWCRVGCVLRLAWAIRRPGWDQSADGARLPQAGGCPLARPAPDVILNSGTLRMGGVPSQSWRTRLESLW